MTIDLDNLIAKAGYKPGLGQAYSAKVYKTRLETPQSSPDSKRVLALPRRPIPDVGTPRGEALIELANETYGRANSQCECADLGRECITSLNLVQAWALHEIRTQQGLLGPIGVGHGKTLLDLLAPLAVANCDVALLLVPPSLIPQLVAEHRLLSQHFHVPTLSVHQSAGAESGRLVAGTKPVTLHVLSYNLLSHPNSTSLIGYIAPRAIIADECHKLKNPKTATTSRFLRYLENNPQTVFACWTGTLTDKSIKEYAHLAKYALRDRAPLPLDEDQLRIWAGAIDPGPNRADPGVLFELCEPGEAVWEGYNRRLTETHGVVSTSAPAVVCGLRFDERRPDVPREIRDALNELRETKQRPDGEDLIDAFSVSRCALELSCGFFYRWRFPRGEPVSLIEEWRRRRSAWRKELREFLEPRAEHLDSERLCTLAAMRAWGHVANKKQLPEWRAAAWPAWYEIKDQVQPETEAVRVHSFLAVDAAEWALSNRGIVWYAQREFGLWVSEISGLPLHAGGPDAAEKIGAEKGDRSVIASIKSHGTGRNGLQYLFDRQLVAMPPTTASDWEQMLGRLVRIGQKAPEVVTTVYQHTEELRENLQTARDRAGYVESTLGAKQKLNVWSI